MQRRQKLIVIVALWAVIAPTILTEVLAYSISFRDSFFYADYYVADSILTNGHIPTQITPDLRYWGKIGTRLRQPLLPISMSIGTLFTSLPLYVFHSHFPIFPIIALIFYLISREFTRSTIALSAAIAAGTIAPYLGANLAGFRGIKTTLYFLIVYLFIRQVRSSPQFQKRCAILIPILLIHLLYNKPRIFIISSFFCVCSVAMTSLSGRQAQISIVGAVASGFWIILATPFRAYTTFGLVATSQLFGVGLIEVDSSGANGVHILQSSPFGFPLFLPVSFAFGALGGLLIVRWSIKSLYNRTLSEYSILVSWGLAIMMFVVFQLFTGEIWLIYRSIGDAFPVIILGAAVAIDYLSERSWWSSSLQKKAIIAALILLLLTPIGASFVLGGVSNPVRNVHSYHSEDIETQTWSSTYIPEEKAVLSDMQHASLLIRRPPSSVYPLSEETLESIFYKGQLDTAPSHSYLWLDQEMVDKGLYVPPFPREPISNGQYKSWKTSGDVVYTTGQSSIIHRDTT